MNEQEQNRNTPERRPAGEDPESNANLEATRAAHQRLHQIARAVLEKVSAQNAGQELEARRQRGGE